jgi:NodT family efflux transporter outer membrane factor (OMF) lipoprotein
MRRILALGAATALSACAVGPNYHRPEVVAPAAVPFATQTTATDPAGQLPDRWWSLYNDPALDALVAEALAHNSDLRVAAANVDRARAVLGGERAAFLPSTQVTASVQRGRTASGVGTGTGTTSGTTPTRTIDRAAFQASWEIDLFGRIRRSIEAAKADLAATEATRDATRVTIAAATTQAYLDVCLTAARVDVANQSVALIGQSYDITRQQVELGAASDYELSRVGVLAEQTRAQAAQLEGARRSALADLAVLLGRPAGQPPAEAVACRTGPRLSRIIPTGDGAAMLARRPDIRSAERSLAADTARIGIATADLFPTISIGGSVAVGGTSVGNAVSRSGTTFGVGPLLSWFFPNIAAARANMLAAGAEQRASLARFDGAVQTALGEVERALAAYDAEIKRNAALTAAVTNSMRAYDLSGVRLRYGSISQLEQIDVQRDLIASQASLAESNATLADAQVALFRALGGGWQEAPAIDPRPTLITGNGRRAN